MRIVTYHYIRDVANSEWPQMKALATQAFSDQVKWLKKTGRVISPDEFIGKVLRDEVMRDKDTLLTFDDAYEDHWVNVKPILEDEGVSGLFFVSTQAVWERKLTDTNKIQLILGKGVKPIEVIAQMERLVNLHRQQHGLLECKQYRYKYAVANRFDSPEVKYIKNMLQFGLPTEVRELILTQLFYLLVSKDEQSVADELYMTSRQVAQLVLAGHGVGNHGHTHSWLDKLTINEQRQDIHTSLNLLATVGMGVNEWAMCYPYGAFNNETVQVLRELKCGAAFTTKGGETVNSLGDRRYQINRLDANEI